MTKPQAPSKALRRVDWDAPELYINRELSWLEFNDRVLREGLCEDSPPLERLKFLAIVSSNLDEFFMIRVAGLKQQRSARLRRRGAAGMTPVQQLDAIAARTHRMVAEQTEGLRRLVETLASRGVHLKHRPQWTGEQQEFLRSYVQTQILPILTPLAMQRLDPPPVLPGLRLMLALRLPPAGGKDAEPRVAIVPVPEGLPRFLALPAAEGQHFARLEDAVAANIDALLGGEQIVGSAVFRITRDADVAIDDDASDDLLAAVEQAVSDRRRRSVVRLEIQAGAEATLKNWLLDFTGADDEDVYEIDGLLDASALMEIATRPGLDKLREADWPPQPPRDLLGRDDLWAALQERDVLLFHPYESFEPVVRLIRQAADDPNVLAIKQTLYRTSGESPIIAALERAARNGKQVVALVELKARFDEQRNVHWARRLEQAGAYVIYGIAGYKTHAKALLIVRREADRVRRYVHLSTGNYNDRTARLYSDIGVMTSNNEIAADVAAFFNLLTGTSEAVGWSKLTIAPGGLRSRFVELIKREIQSSTPQQPGCIVAKVNSLQDQGVCQALYQAARAGVQVRLNVRGICCLRPGLPGISENIEVVSIVDRFLEHARIFYFRNGGHEEVYMSSADWMTRNLDQRLEILFPITSPELRARLIAALDAYFADNVKARRLKGDGTYEPVPRRGQGVRAQEVLYNQAVDAVKAAAQPPQRFRPLTKPEAS